MVSHVLSDEHATGNGNVIRKDSESASVGKVALKLQPSGTESGKPQVTVFVSDRAVEFVAEIVRPHAIIEPTRALIGVGCRTYSRTESGPFELLMNEHIRLKNVQRACVQIHIQRVNGHKVRFPVRSGSTGATVNENQVTNVV